MLWKETFIIGINCRQIKKLLLASLSSILIPALSGCYQPVNESILTAVQTRPTATLQIESYFAGRSVENRTIECIVIGNGSNITLILASIHGDEQAGTPLVYRLIEHLKQHPHLIASRQVIIVPQVNPDGMAHNTRSNARGVDLNRNFSTGNRINSSKFGQQALSEPEALVISQLIRMYNPNRIISIHQPFGCIDYDGPAKTLARRMAEYCRLPVNKLGGLPGSLGSYAGFDLGIPTITLELPGPKGLSNFDSDSLWENYGNCLLAALVYPQRLR